MTPTEHSLLSVRDFGGSIEDYMKIHKFLDQTKFHTTNFHHRLFLHNTMGISLCEQTFGDYLVNSQGKKISVREVARLHILQDCGVVPTLQQIIEAVSANNYSKYNRPRQKDLEWLKENNSNNPLSKSVQLSITE